MKAQTCTKFGANRSSRLVDFPDFCIFDPLNPPKFPLGYRGANCFWHIPFPNESADVYQIWCQSVHPFGSFSRFVNFWPPKTPKSPLGDTGQIFIFPTTFLGESACVCQIWSRSDHRRRRVYAWKDTHTDTHSPICVVQQSTIRIFVLGLPFRQCRWQYYTTSLCD